MGLLDLLRRKRKRKRRNTDRGRAHRQADPDLSLVEAILDARRIASDFGDFLCRPRHPLIPDASLLPHPKHEIMKALVLLEAMTSMGMPVAGGDPANAEHDRDTAIIGRTWLEPSTEIDAGDRDAVAHFNGFESLTDIPHEELAACWALMQKYPLTAGGYIPLADLFGDR